MAIVNILNLQNVHTAEKVTEGHSDSEAMSVLNFKLSAS